MLEILSIRSVKLGVRANRGGRRNILIIARNLLYDRNMQHHSWSWVFGPVELGRAIKDARIAIGMQQNDLAQLLGVSRMTVSRLERGESVSMSTALAALTECGAAAVIVPKGARVTVDA